MYELHPYFTNDGTVGLYSPTDDDIYHSTYGALTESWEKFVIPAHFREYIAANDEVKILDICYGIGYNTKTALNVFLDESEKKEKKYLEDNKINNKINLKKIKNILQSKLNTAAIDTDNIFEDFSKKDEAKNDEIHENCENNICCNATLDTDNISQGFEFNNPICKREYYSKNKILIDAVDSDKILIGLSPFVVEEVQNKFLFKTKYFKTNKNNFQNKNTNDKNKISNNTKNKLDQIQKMQKTQISPNGQFGFLKNEFRLKREVSIILLEKLLKNDSDSKNNLIDDEILQKLLCEKKYSPYISKFMRNLARFCSNRGCNYTKKDITMAFLHNIYYQYVSKSYKNAKKMLNNSQIDLNFHPQDARSFIQSTSSTYNFVFLDAFTPSKCPALWTLDFFNVLYSKLNNDGMILTYSNSAAIRNAFLKSGFYVGKIYNEKTNKFTGTVAVKNINLIEHPLGDQDLDLINSKAGICYRDENLNHSNEEITENRNTELSQSDLITSSKVIKGYKGNKNG